MAGAWKTHAAYTTQNGRLRISLQSPVEEPHLNFLDIRRAFEKHGEVLPTKRGIRVNTSSVHLTHLAEALKLIAQGTVKRQESGGLRLVRWASSLQVRKAAPMDSEPRVLIVLSSEEAIFLLKRLYLAFGEVEALEADLEDDGQVEDEVMEPWL